MTEGNFGWSTSRSVSNPSHPYYGWLPTKNAPFVRCALGMFSFSSSSFFLFVYSMSLLYRVNERFEPIAVLLGVEFTILLLYKQWQGELRRREPRANKRCSRSLFHPQASFSASPSWASQVRRQQLRASCPSSSSTSRIVQCPCWWLVHRGSSARKSSL
jgi:hypothetical protein